jgi:hypothetical protein
MVLQESTALMKADNKGIYGPFPNHIGLNKMLKQDISQWGI